jgi:hypothetical protein
MNGTPAIQLVQPLLASGASLVTAQAGTSDLNAGAGRSEQWGTNQAGTTVPVTMLNLGNVSAILLANVNAPASLSMLHVGNGTTGMVPVATVDVANIGAAVVPNGVLMTDSPGNWSQSAEPAADTVATTSKAGVALQRHVCTAIGASIVGVAAIAAPIYLRLRDGATGAGTILWSQAFVVPLGQCLNFALSGLNIVGTVATAMTLEFSASPGATNFQTVSLSGRTVA